MKKDSLLVKAGRKFDSYYGSMNPPVYHSSTLVFPNLKGYTEAKAGDSIYDVIEDGVKRDYSYGSVGTPTAHYFASALAKVEGRGQALLYPTGLLALTLCASVFARSGSHILIPDNSYYRLKRFAEEELKSMGVEVTFYDPTESISHLIKENTAVIMIESPASITFEITDIKPIVEIAKRNNIKTIYDNSWATSLYFKPLDHGIDIAVYAVTKYINGHSDMLMGAVIAEGEVFKRLYAAYRNYGISIQSDDCYLAHRGLRTLHIRLNRHRENAMKVISWLEKHELVRHVLYPALPSHPQHELWMRDFSGAGGLFSIILDIKYREENLEAMLSGMKLFSIGASWGGCDSLILPVDIESPRLKSKNISYTGTCIRIFCGLEDPDDLIEDLENGLMRLSVSSRAELETSSF